MIDIDPIDADTACRNIVDITSPRMVANFVSLMEVSDKRARHMFWLQAMGLIETWFMI